MGEQEGSRRTGIGYIPDGGTGLSGAGPWSKKCGQLPAAGKG